MSAFGALKSAYGWLSLRDIMQRRTNGGMGGRSRGIWGKEPLGTLRGVCETPGAQDK